MTPTKPAVGYQNYNTYLWDYIPDKTGTYFQTLAGNVGAGTPWGLRVWRCPPNAAPELIVFIPDGNGKLFVNVMTKELWLLGTDANRSTFILKIDGYVFPSDCPDSTVVNINEAQVATLKQSIATTQQIAQSASATANEARGIATDTAAQLAQLQRTVTALQSQVNGLLTPSQVADLVWQKIKDINYLYRLAFLAWPTPNPDQDIRAYVADLVALIRKAK
jgi:hypothetical protein